MAHKFFKTLVLTSSLLVTSSPQQEIKKGTNFDISENFSSSSTASDSIHQTTQEEVKKILSDSPEDHTQQERVIDSSVAVITPTTLEHISEQPLQVTISPTLTPERKIIGVKDTSEYNTTPVEKEVKNISLLPESISSEIVSEKKDSTKEKKEATKEVKKTPNAYYFSTVVDSIVTPSSKIDFDVEYVKKKIHILLEQCFTVENKELLFTYHAEKKQKAQVIIIMDNIRQHIKDNNNWFVNIFLSKKALRNFMTEELDTIYDILVEGNKLQYAGGEEKFKQDFHSLIDIYK